MESLYTTASKNIGNQPWDVYPRPQMERTHWINLNGEWDFCDSDDSKWCKITVPFCPESLLSGINRTYPYGGNLKYRRKFELQQLKTDEKVILHFGAVDGNCEVFCNGSKVTEHESSYLPFEADITEFIEPENILELIVKDNLDPQYPHGKQKNNRGGMWYTPCSGIWQTVWLECVPQKYIERLVIDARERTADSWLVAIKTCGVDEGSIRLISVGTENTQYDLRALPSYPVKNGRTEIEITNPLLWSPEEPNLYRFEIESGSDSVKSYFALRNLSILDADNGEKYQKLALNGKKYFFNGVLDQGYWSDGLYTPASPDCFEQDILEMKYLGFNTMRKHIKVEAERYYYDCDRLGMIVFQDMVNNGKYSFIRDSAIPTIGIQKLGDRQFHRNPKQRDIFLRNMIETVSILKNHPCICLWTVFNEGWGQFNADAAYKKLKQIDSTRFIDATSGWFRQKLSDVESLHIYFGKLHMGKSDKPQFLSEYGGYSYKILGHCTNVEKTYGYKKYTDNDRYIAALKKLQEKISDMKNIGLSAAVYTQVSDVEDETNGLLTYDRFRKIER